MARWSSLSFEETLRRVAELSCDPVRSTQCMVYSSLIIRRFHPSAIVAGLRASISEREEPFLHRTSRFNQDVSRPRLPLNE